MNQALIANPALSPRFALARKLSSVVAILFIVAFLLVLAIAMAMPAAEVFLKPRGMEIGLFSWRNGVRVNFAALSGWPAIGALGAVQLMVLPTVLALYYAFRLFFCFANGQVFAAQPNSHIRAAGLWLTVSFLTDAVGVILLRLCGVKSGSAVTLWSLGALSIGIAIIVAAYVMEEARRIVVDNAEIV